jgi:hypothetical protein
LLEQSGLPGARANLELVAAAADLASEQQALGWLDSGDEFLALCGAVTLGRLLAEGRRDVLPRLRQLASDQRWRIREGVAMALQRWGDADVAALARVLEGWAAGNRYEQRAAAAGLCEPRLLKPREVALSALDLLDSITMTMAGADDARGDGFRVLRQAMGYCWSVAVAALPDPGLERFTRWERSTDPHVGWIVRENLKKDRLKRLVQS